MDEIAYFLSFRVRYDGTRKKMKIILQNFMLIILCYIVKGITNKTRIATFIIAKLKKSKDQTNIDKYELAANITEYHIISKLIFQRIIIPKFNTIRHYFI